MNGPDAAPEPQGVAAFDFDGTMIRGDSFMPFLVRAVGPGKFGQIVIRSSASTAQAYRLGRRDASKAVLVRRLLRGYPADRLDDLGRRYAVLLAQRIRPQMAERVAWHQQRGHRLVIVSASLDVYLAPTGKALGFDQVLATELEVGSDGRLTGRLLGPNVRGVEKSARLREWLAQELAGVPYQLWAYGDSAGDRELLAMADHPTRV
ncbi:MAG: phosphatidylglycerophosphatase [Acidimicrobiaceae bacterium]|nr:phosphatidylglycerophosphatase [Acidimicrobiaceae bacterium]MDQ1416608.1 phosphatidylglycerophosphatase [Acidimicrobiaceae bacterium]MDQ1419834.1 phosphatidylglycerophosphatase [Acidimicrobiaceae bacterium]